MDSIDFLCTIHNADVRVSWRDGRPEDAYALCPMCIAEECKMARTELAVMRSQRDGLLKCIDLKRSVLIKETP